MTPIESLVELFFDIRQKKLLCDPEKLEERIGEEIKKTDESYYDEFNHDYKNCGDGQALLDFYLKVWFTKLDQRGGLRFLSKRMELQKCLFEIVLQGDFFNIYRNGVTVRGTFVNGLRQGKFTEIRPEGVIIHGSFVNGVREGQFLESRPNITKLVGNYICGIKKGDFVESHIDGTTMEGTYVDGIKQGGIPPEKEIKQGVYDFRNKKLEIIFDNEQGYFVETNPDGTIIRGTVDRNGIKQGDFMIKQPNGLLEKGKYVNGIVQGTLIISNPNDESRTEITYLNGNNHGIRMEYRKDGTVVGTRNVLGTLQGDWIQVSPNGKIIKGKYVDGIKQGDYILSFPDGKIIKGKYIDGDKQDSVKVIKKLSDGRTIEENFVLGIQQGDYIETFPDGKIIKGKYVNGIKQEDHIVTFPDGRIIKVKVVDGIQYFVMMTKEGQVIRGIMVNGKAKGRFIETFPNGSIYEGIFVQGKMTERKKVRIDASFPDLSMSPLSLDELLELLQEKKTQRKKRLQSAIATQQQLDSQRRKVYDLFIELDEIQISRYLQGQNHLVIGVLQTDGQSFRYYGFNVQQVSRTNNKRRSTNIRFAAEINILIPRAVIVPLIKEERRNLIYVERDPQSDIYDVIGSRSVGEVDFEIDIFPLPQPPPHQE